MTTQEKESGGILEGALRPDNSSTRPQPLAWADYETSVLSQWQNLLNSGPEEPAVQKFLELHPAMIPGGSGDIGPGGHHGSEMSGVFREPVLKGAGRDLRPDFMWVTRSTSLITPILIEIEKPSKRWFQSSTGRPTAELRDALDQLNDWRSWFTEDQNMALFRQNFLFSSSYADRPIEPQYVLIYGRQSEFEPGGGHKDPGALRHKRDLQRRPSESFMTFDSLRPRFDHANSMTLTMRATGPEVFAFSPLYGTDTYTGEDALLLGEPDAGLERSVMITPERKLYLSERWEHWKKIEQEARLKKRSLRPRQLGSE